MDQATIQLRFEIVGATKPALESVFLVAAEVVDDHVVYLVVPRTGLEPARISPADFKSAVFTNFTTRAAAGLYRGPDTKKGKRQALSLHFGAAEESRTLDLYLGKVSLYQLSYCRKTLEARAGVEPTYTDLQSGA